VFDPNLMEGESLFEVGDPVDLPGDKNRVIEQHRGSLFLDHLPALAIEVVVTGRRHPDLGTRRKHDLAFPPGGGGSDDG
jgi:hypothetical protein